MTTLPLMGAHILVLPAHPSSRQDATTQSIGDYSVWFVKYPAHQSRMGCWLWGVKRVPTCSSPLTACLAVEETKVGASVQCGDGESVGAINPAIIISIFSERYFGHPRRVRAPLLVISWCRVAMPRTAATTPKGGAVASVWPGAMQQILPRPGPDLETADCDLASPSAASTTPVYRGTRYDKPRLIMQCVRV